MVTQFEQRAHCDSRGEEFVSNVFIFIVILSLVVINNINIVLLLLSMMMIPRKTMVTQLELIAIQGRGLVGWTLLDGQSDRNKIELRLKDTKIRPNKSQLK